MNYISSVTIPFQDPKALEAYCLPFIRGEKKPETAADLMASRYVAYATQAIDFLVTTVLPRNRTGSDRKSAEIWSKRSSWQGLEILRTEKGGPDDTDGIVEFVARYSVEGAEQRHHEIAEFKKLDGEWFFADGNLVEATAPRQEPIRNEGPKIGRNDPCHCGSGKKFKKCHALKA
ncbi:MAG: SEC-C domain-containing protein [Polyangiaceae bacterium]|nr:SEC-C domain-containing protein [Polyangiaceae bacterium]